MDVDGKLRRRELMLRVATRLGDEGFLVDPRFRLTLIRMVKTSSPTSEGPDNFLEYGHPIYIKQLGYGRRVIAKVDREEDGMIDPKGFIHFETWHNHNLEDMSNQTIDHFLKGLGSKPIISVLRMTVGQIRKFANA